MSSLTIARHALEPLTPDEIVAAVTVIREQAKLASSYRFVSVTLREPAKEIVLAGKPTAREAFLILLDNATGRGYEAIVDVAQRQPVSMLPLREGVQPPIMLDEFVECEEAVKRSPEFLAALKLRGVEDVNLVMVDPWSAGVYGTELPDEKHRRISRALCWLRTEPMDNGYARPIDGLTVVVDLNTMEVLRIEDHGVIPLPPTAGNWAREYIPETRPDLKPLEVQQPHGASFEIDGHEIRWQKWRFRISFTPREGLVLHTVSYRDGGRERPILYRASVVEMVVPYGDPRVQYFRKNAFDLGEYGIGMLANSLVLGCDCLGLIRYFDAHMTDSRGNLVTIKNAVCLHEEDHGVLWKHTDWRTNQTEVRRSRRLVVSFVATVANYEYGFYWHFYQDGSIQLEVKLTGIMNTTSLHPGETPGYGTEVAPQLNAPNHQHFFCARLDMNVDGQRNTVEEVNTIGHPTGPDNPHGNAFTAKVTPLTRESVAARTTNAATSRFWRIVNPQQKNKLGRPVGYRLVPGENAIPFADGEAAVLKRAGFLNKHLWVTPYHPDERFPAGDYPNQNPGGDGLPKWTAADRAIDDTDVVVWYTFGHTHIPRPEDWPVMPASSIGFFLKPDGFFNANPALDLPPSPPKPECCH
ncbi:MAG: primary-amine oxidase [Planctomycetes bacterium]|nr:primary-amine oxidase [Planctomycetota bacterium]